MTCYPQMRPPPRSAPLRKWSLSVTGVNAGATSRCRTLGFETVVASDGNFGIFPPQCGTAAAIMAEE